jgi:hypothetical protein
MSEFREEGEIEITDNEVGEYDQGDITSPFSLFIF